MKLYQTDTSEKAYFILESNCELEAPVHVAFEDFDMAKAYLNRFRTYSDAQIVECHLNPGFYTDIRRDCFFIQLNRNNDVYVISLVNDLERSEMAIREHSFIEVDQICVYAIAVDESEALKMARKVKEKYMALS